MHTSGLVIIIVLHAAEIRLARNTIRINYQNAAAALLLEFLATT